MPWMINWDLSGREYKYTTLTACVFSKMVLYLWLYRSSAQFGKFPNIANASKQIKMLQSPCKFNEQFERVIFRWIRSIGRCTGNDIFADKYRPNWFTVIMVGAALLLPIIYVLIYLYYDNDEIVIKAAGLFGTAIKVNKTIMNSFKLIILSLFYSQIATKAIFPLLAHRQIVDVVRFLRSFYQRNESSIQNKATINGFGDILTKAAQMVIINYVFCTMMCFVSPICVYLWSGSRVDILPIVVPGTTFVAPLEYAFNLVVQSFFVFVACTNFLHYDLLFLVPVLHIKLLTDILRQKLRTIGREDDAKRVACMTKAIVLHNELIGWVLGQK